MALYWRIWTAVVLVNLAVLTIFVGLATLQFDKIHSALVGERLAVLGERIAGPFEAAARIGLPLSDVRNANALLERARQTDEAISAVHVFDIAGQIVHSTEAAAPAMIPAAAIAALNVAKGGPWHVETAHGFFSGIDIAATDGTTAGGIMIVYPARESATRVRAMGAELAIIAMGVMLAAGALGALLLRFGLARQIRLFEAIDGAVEGFERDAWRSAAADAASQPPAADAAGLRLMLDAAETRYRAIGRAIAASRDRAP